MIKVEAFSLVLQELTKFAKAISHPARLEIPQYLAETKTCISGDISENLPLSRSTVSQHLNELREIRLIHGEFDGLKVNYCLCNSKIQQFIQIFDDFFKDISAIDITCKLDPK